MVSSREHHERTHTCMRVVQALAVRIAPCRGAEWKQARTIAPITSDRKPRLHHYVKTISQGVQGLDAGLVIHQSERIPIDVESAALQPGPLPDAGACKPPFETFVAPLTFRRVDRLILP